MAAAALLSATPAAQAAFFQLGELSPAAGGNAYAGGAAAAEDASTVWFNPAGLTHLTGSQLVLGLHHVDASIEFSKAAATLNPLLGGGPISGGNGGDAGESALIPNLYFARRIDQRLAFGLGINAPFGLATDYDDDWVGRYHADRSEVRSININPALAYQLSPQLSLGGGINYQWLEGEFTQAVDYGSLCALAAVGACAAPGANDGRARVKAHDDAWGYNLGVLWQPSGETRLGLAYRSRIKYHLEGNFEVTAPSATAAAVGAAAGIVNSGASANVSVPATLSFSVHQSIARGWTLMGDVTRTYWSKLPELRIDFDSAQPDSVTTLDLKDVNRYSVGATYDTGGSWRYRVGFALDRTPTPNAARRTPRLPDADRTWIALGAGYRFSQALSVDLSFVHVRLDDAPIDKVSASPTDENFLRGSLAGNYKGKANILSAQVKWLF
jgi:long-chain fatty acid transport protein